MTDQTNIRKRSIIITLSVILFVVMVAVLKNMTAERRWLNMEPVAEQVAAYRTAGQPLVVYFHSPDCSSCDQVKQSLDQVYPEFKGAIALLDVDVTNRRERPFVDVTGIQTTPTLLFIDSGGTEKLFVGEISPDVLRAELATLAGDTP